MLLAVESLKTYCRQQEPRRAEDSCPSTVHSCAHTRTNAHIQREIGRKGGREREWWNVLGQHASVYVVLALRWANRQQMASGLEPSAGPNQAGTWDDWTQTVTPVWTERLFSAEHVSPAAFSVHMCRLGLTFFAITRGSGWHLPLVQSSKVCLRLMTHTHVFKQKTGKRKQRVDDGK